MTYDVRLVEPCINEAHSNETTDDNLIPLKVITHVYLTILTGGDCGCVVLLVSAHVSPVPGLQTGSQWVSKEMIQLVPQEQIQENR